jgi:hypothetical protein
MLHMEKAKECTQHYKCQIGTVVVMDEDSEVIIHIDLTTGYLEYGTYHRLTYDMIYIYFQTESPA